MLYTSTRNKTDSFTAHRVLHEDRTPEGGYFLPLQIPYFDQAQLQIMKNQSFGETVAQILNLFFSTELTGWDVDCAIGKTAAKVITMSHRVILVKLWDNPKGDFAYIIDQLYKKLTSSHNKAVATDWAHIAIRIAVLFGIYSILPSEVGAFDVSLNAGDFSVPMSAWYARKMGLSIGTVVCACNENSAAWDFLHRGEMNTGLSKVDSDTPELDVPCPPGLERLIFSTLGFELTRKYLDVTARKGLYCVRPDILPMLNEGLFVSVVGKDRVASVIRSVYRSNQCVLDPYTAVSYGSLQDYRAKTGESCPTVLLWERSPVQYDVIVNKATGLSKENLEKHLNQI